MATPMTKGQKLVWDVVPGAVEYRVRLKAGTTVVFETTKVLAEIEGSELLANQPHAQYTVQVAANDGVGYGIDSFIVIDFQALPGPGNLAVV